MSKMYSEFAKQYEDFVRMRIAEFRGIRDISARQLSLSLEQSQNYISNIENNVSFPSMHTFFCILECLDATPFEFFDEQAKDPQPVRDMLVAFKALNAEDQQDLLRLATKLGNNSKKASDPE